MLLFGVDCISDKLSILSCQIEPSVAKPPPAKYKLWLIIFILVYFAEWFSSEAQFQQSLIDTGWLSPNASLFINLAIVVFTLTFSTLDLFVTMFTFEIKGHTYGVEPWLKQGRVLWIRQKENILAEFLTCIVDILEDGFRMFDGAEPAMSSTQDVDEFELESSIDNSMVERSSTTGNAVVLKIQHFINPFKIDEYYAWNKKIQNATKYYAKGLIDVKKRPAEVITEDIYVQDGDSGLVTQKSIKGKKYTIIITFDNIDRLNGWMTSKKRKKLIEELQPLLVEPDIVQIQKNRCLPDAFTDLLIRQGNDIPVLSPKKWKVWWLTTIGLFFTLLWTRDSLPFYYEKWNLDTAHPRVLGLVSVFISTFINSYIMTPLLLFLFSNWLITVSIQNCPGEYLMMDLSHHRLNLLCQY